MQKLERSESGHLEKSAKFNFASHLITKLVDNLKERRARSREAAQLKRDRRINLDREMAAFTEENRQEVRTAIEDMIHFFSLNFHAVQKTEQRGVVAVWEILPKHNFPNQKGSELYISDDAINPLPEDIFNSNLKSVEKQLDLECWEQALTLIHMQLHILASRDYSREIKELVYGNLSYASALAHEGIASKLKKPEAKKHELALAITEYLRALHRLILTNATSFGHYADLVTRVEGLVKALELEDSNTLAESLHSAYFSNNGQPRQCVQVAP
jgi:hypothetical protein